MKNNFVKSQILIMICLILFLCGFSIETKKKEEETDLQSELSCALSENARLEQDLEEARAEVERLKFYEKSAEWFWYRPCRSLLACVDPDTDRSACVGRRVRPDGAGVPGTGRFRNGERTAGNGHQEYCWHRDIPWCGYWKRR